MSQAFEDMTELEKGAVEGLLMMRGAYWTMDRSVFKTVESKPTTDLEQNVTVSPQIPTSIEHPAEFAAVEKNQSMQSMTVNRKKKRQKAKAKTNISSQKTALKAIPIPDVPPKSRSGKVKKHKKHFISESGEENVPPTKKAARKKRPKQFSDDSITDGEIHPKQAMIEPDFVYDNSKFEMVENWLQTVNDSNDIVQNNKIIAA